LAQAGNGGAFGAWIDPVPVEFEVMTGTTWAG
jgi:hypothetical protein